MTFTQVTFKNFRFNLRKYMAYFLCSSFCITILFMFSTLWFNDDIIDKIRQTSIYGTIEFSLGGLVIFTLFFLSYAHNSFMKSRSKEFGLFLTLGMTRKEINKIIFIENFSIVSGALIFGSLCGAIFSRIFFMLVMEMLDFKTLKFHISIKCFLLVVIIFLCSVILITIISTINTRKLEISELLKYDRKEEINKLNNPLRGIIGILMIIGSFVLMNLTILRIVFNGKAAMLPIYVVMGCVGLYLTISQFGVLSEAIKKVRKESYLHNIISLSEIKYRFNQYRKIFFVLALLSGTAVFFIGVTLCVKVNTKQIVFDNNPYDISYQETLDINKLSQGELEKIILNGDTDLTEKLTLNYFKLIQLEKNDEGIYENWGHVPILSEKDAKKILNTDMNIEKGHIIRIYAFKEKNSFYNNGDEVRFRNLANGEEYSFKFDKTIYDTFVNDKFIAWVVSEEEYNDISKEIDKENLYRSHMMNFKDWKKTLSIYTELFHKLNEINGTSYSYERPLDYRYKWRSAPQSKYWAYTQAVKENNFYLFAMGFVGLIFFISSGVVLYFKIYTEIEEGKIRYEKLFKIGITDRQMEKIISKELRRIFFIPIFIGCLFGFGYIAALYVEYSYYEQLLGYSALTILLYMMFQYIFYRVTRKKYIREVI